ncbi:hypothetical protein GGX14DRAFT_396596 [Mycena pura]|uniref:DUF6534 domain-containing protein n=1 Tax=Mycena pura TaxID=153505 RepID=A0AAD6Y8H2_9AGAR|nr:hypothetical protein GGX14DRAFT_396596 [Mycena pura]
MASTFNARNTLVLQLHVGAFQIGLLVSYMLFGITTTQSYLYYNRFPEDSRKLKTLNRIHPSSTQVAVVWLCEAAHAASFGAMLHTFTITDYGHPERWLQKTPVSLDVAVLFAGVITAIVQGFFSFRIYALSKKLYLAIIFWALSILCFLVSISLSIGGVMSVSFTSYVAQWGWVAIVAWALGASTDLGITVTLVFLLLRGRSKHEKSTALLDKLIAWTIVCDDERELFVNNTLKLLSSADEVFAVIWLGLYTSSIFNGLRVFANSLLASLNSRAALRAMNESTMSMHTVSSAEEQQISRSIQFSAGRTNDKEL